MITFIPLLIIFGVLQQTTEAPPTSKPTQQWTRRAEGNNTVSLEIVSRRYEAQGRPDVWLVGVAHIADNSFYEEIAALLSEMDIVLYESVRPSGSRPANGQTEEERVESTKRSLAFVADVAVRSAETTNIFPISVGDVTDQTADIDPRLARWISNASIDAWGNAFVLHVDETDKSLTFVSFGSDGKVGGTGHAADLTSTRKVTILDDDAVGIDSESGGNIQKELADVLGLAFQLETLPYQEAHWICSDLTIDEVEAKLIERGADTSLIRMLTGDSFAAVVATSLMKLVPMLDSIMGGGVKESARLLMIEVLSMPESDQLLVGIEPELAQVIIVDRNTELLKDLALTLQSAKDISGIGVLYGAGHMYDLAPRMKTMFGYVPVEDRWIRAMSVDPSKSLLSEKDLKRMRFMLRYQLHMAKKKARNKKSGANSSE